MALTSALRRAVWSPHLISLPLDETALAVASKAALTLDAIFAP
jgi:hypothetical protein